VHIGMGKFLPRYGWALVIAWPFYAEYV
jgi:hypothetical protein